MFHVPCSMFHYFRAKRENGFTILELLVVIAIIGLIASLTIVGLSTVRAKSRDSRRIADVKTVRAALDSYYITYKQYPPSSSCQGGATDMQLTGAGDSLNSTLLANDIIKTPVIDPINGVLDNITYGIYYNSCGVIGSKTPDPDTVSARNNEYYAITLVLETDSFTKQGYAKGNNCVGPKISPTNKTLGGSLNGSLECNPAP